MSIIRSILRTSADVQIVDEFYSNQSSQISNKHKSSKTISAFDEDHLHVHKSKPVNDENTPNQATLVNRNIKMKPTQKFNSYTHAFTKSSTEKSLNVASVNDKNKVSTGEKYAFGDSSINRNINNRIHSTFKNSSENFIHDYSCDDTEEMNCLATNTSLNMSLCNRSRTSIRRNTDKLFYGGDSILDGVECDDLEDDEDAQNALSTNTSLNISVCNRSRVEIRRNTDKLFYDNDQFRNGSESDDEDNHEMV